MECGESYSIKNDFGQIIEEIKKRQDEPDAVKKVLQEHAEDVEIAIRVIIDAITVIAEATYEVFGMMMDYLSDTFHQISEIWDEVLDYDPKMIQAVREGRLTYLQDAFHQISEMRDQVIDYDPTNVPLKRWRANERRYSAVITVKYGQFERERANRSSVLRGNMKIGQSGRRTGPKKAKDH